MVIARINIMRIPCLGKKAMLVRQPDPQECVLYGAECCKGNIFKLKLKTLNLNLISVLYRATVLESIKGGRPSDRMPVLFADII